MEFDTVLLPERRARMLDQKLWHQRTINDALTPTSWRWWRCEWKAASARNSPIAKWRAWPTASPWGLHVLG